jgi:hypothetical protein
LLAKASLLRPSPEVARKMNVGADVVQQPPPVGGGWIDKQAVVAVLD